MVPLLLALVLAGVPLAVDKWPGEIPTEHDEAPMKSCTRTISFTGRFTPDGKVATIEIEESSGFGKPPEMARILTDECRAKSRALDFEVMEPLAILDLDADGRDEIIFLSGGNTIFLAVVARVDGCRLVALERSDAPRDPELAFYSHSNCCPDSGSGIFCRRTAEGRVEIVTTEYAWEPWDFSDPDTAVRRPTTEAPWTRTVYVVRGKQLVVTQKDAGTTKIHDDPSVPLLNRFDCLGKTYP